MIRILILLVLALYAFTPEHSFALGGGSEVGNGRSRPAAPGEQKGGQVPPAGDQKGEPRKDAPHPAPQKPAPSVDVEKTDVKTPEVKEGGEAAIELHLKVNNAAGVESCDASFVEAGTGKFAIKAEGCSVVGQESGWALVRVTHRFPSKTVERRYVLDHLGVNFKGEGEWAFATLPTEAITFAVRPDVPAVDLAVVSAKLSPEGGCKYGETFELSVEFASDTQATWLTLLMDVTYGDGAIERETLWFWPGDAFTQTQRDGRLVVTMPLIVPDLPTAATRVEFVGFELDNEGYQHGALALPQRLAVEPKR